MKTRTPHGKPHIVQHGGRTYVILDDSRQTQVSYPWTLAEYIAKAKTPKK